MSTYASHPAGPAQSGRARPSPRDGAWRCHSQHVRRGRFEVLKQIICGETPSQARARPGLFVLQFGKRSFAFALFLLASTTGPARACYPKPMLPMMLNKGETLASVKVHSKEPMKERLEIVGSVSGIFLPAAILTLETVYTHRGKHRDFWHVVHRGHSGENLFDKNEVWIAAITPAGSVVSDMGHRFDKVTDQQGRIVDEFYQLPCSGSGFRKLSSLKNHARSKQKQDQVELLRQMNLILEAHK